MQSTMPKFLFPELETEKTDDWTFKGANTRRLTHCYHDYPARMIPQIAAKLLDMFGQNAKILFDPYCGTGTSLVESIIRGINAIGTDLNPLACLIAQAKTSTPDLSELNSKISDFQKLIYKPNRSALNSIPKIEGIKNLEFWFKPEVIEKLAMLKKFIDEIENDSVRLFFKIAFSETVRESSNTRNSEFKLFRYKPEKLENFAPDVFGIMKSKLLRNRNGLREFISAMNGNKFKASARVYNFDSVIEIPEKYVNPSSVDIVITSPPYGDSRTTVAYGQYSRLSAAWLELPEPEKIDRKLMGGKRAKEITKFPSPLLNESIEIIAEKDEKRALEVVSFYEDMFKSISNVSNVIKSGGYACYVVANRKVKNTILPTDTAIRDFFEYFGFRYVDTFQRSIPNKRMALRNSPTNIPGEVDSTMIKEFIVVMRKV